eukprot:g30743.t1
MPFRDSHSQLQEGQKFNPQKAAHSAARFAVQDAKTITMKDVRQSKLWCLRGVKGKKHHEERKEKKPRKKKNVFIFFRCLYFILKYIYKNSFRFAFQYSLLGHEGGMEVKPGHTCRKECGGLCGVG